MEKKQTPEQKASEISKILQSVRDLASGNITGAVRARLEQCLKDMLDVVSVNFTERLRKHIAAFFTDSINTLRNYEPGKDRKLVLVLLTSIGHFVHTLINAELENADSEAALQDAVDKAHADCEAELEELQFLIVELKAQIASLETELSEVKTEAITEKVDALNAQRLKFESRIARIKEQRGKKNANTAEMHQKRMNVKETALQRQRLDLSDYKHALEQLDREFMSLLQWTSDQLGQSIETVLDSVFCKFFHPPIFHRSSSSSFT